MPDNQIFDILVVADDRMEGMVFSRIMVQKAVVIHVVLFEHDATLDNDDFEPRG